MKYKNELLKMGFKEVTEEVVNEIKKLKNKDARQTLEAIEKDKNYSILIRDNEVTICTTYRNYKYEFKTLEKATNLKYRDNSVLVSQG